MMKGLVRKCFPHMYSPQRLPPLVCCALARVITMTVHNDKFELCHLGDLLLLEISHTPIALFLRYVHKEKPSQNDR